MLVRFCEIREPWRIMACNDLILWGSNSQNSRCAHYSMSDCWCDVGLSLLFEIKIFILHTWDIDCYYVILTWYWMRYFSHDSVNGKFNSGLLVSIFHMNYKWKWMYREISGHNIHVEKIVYNVYIANFDLNDIWMFVNEWMMLMIRQVYVWC